MYTHTHSHCAHVWVKTGKYNLPLSGEPVDQGEDNISHHVPLEVREGELVIIFLGHRILDLYVEPDVWGEGLEHL